MHDKDANAEIWELEVGEGALSISHTWARRKILELYIPSLSLCFNSDKNIWHCFECSKEKRYSEAKFIEKIDLPEKFLTVLKDYIESKKTLDEIQKWFNNTQIKFDKDS